MPETSIVIRTFNESEFLGDLLDGIRSQDYDDHEVIVVDSGSFDGTVEIAKKFGAQVVEIASRDFTFGFSLNRGIAVARGRFVVLVSAHTKPVDTKWLGALVEPLRDDTVAMTYGRQLGEDRSKFSERQDFRRTFGAHRQVMRPPHFFANNANSAFRRDLWEEHPFNEVLPGLEDVAWAKHWMSRGHDVVYEPQAAIRHIHTESWPQVEHRYFREAVAARALGLRGPRHVLGATLTETGRTAVDIGIALIRASNPRLLPEIARFRWAKWRGTMRGLLDHSEAQLIDNHQAFFFKDDVPTVVVWKPGHASMSLVALPEMKPGDVVIEVAFVGVCGTDLEVFHGTLGYFASGASTYPITPGHEVSGTVVRAGANVRSVKAGDRVVIECIQGCGACRVCDAGEPIRCTARKEMGVMQLNGGYARHVVMPAAHVHRIPHGLDLQRAALCEPLAVAVKGRRRLGSILGPGPHHIGIIGAGSLGQLLALLLMREGHEVSVVDRRTSRRESARRTLPGSNVSDDMRTLLACDGIAEVSGHPDVLEGLLNTVGVGRAVLMLGFPYGIISFNPESVVAQDLALVGSVGSGPADFRAALEILPSLRLDEFLTSTFPLANYADAWEAQREGEVLKVMLGVGS